ncbi:RNA polymerase II-associated protein 1-like [Hydractinia symbiolongicarpus]|uniref:RNA polymerase II-associated protein 1-like n=1 Tax=Hydractinia symbiolongicarpus TaxID=13093 RepID=UPI002550F08F|nr:RNA polymerase II-associated protein 1-like [Hydractinia symbiolongicarpus]
MIKRPSPNENEEDILKFQEEYFTSQEKPSVTIHSKVNSSSKKYQTQQDDTKNRDVVDLGEVKQTTKVDTHIREGRRFMLNEKDFDAAQSLHEKDKDHIVDVLTQIQEHEVKKPYNFSAGYYKTGFPLAPKLNRDQLSCERRTYDGSSKKKSLFAQQFNTFKRQEKLGKKQSEPAASSSADYSPNISSKENHSSIVNVDIKKDPMYETIHEENIQRLKEMGEQKILEEKANLASSLDPKLLSFLRKRAEEKQNNIKINNTDSAKASDTEENKDVGKRNADSEPTHQNGDVKSLEVDPYVEFNIKKDYVHMSDVEKEKLAWMTKIPSVKLKEDSVIPRFDFDGNLLIIEPSSIETEYPISSGLYHHGDDPQLPGYTLQELYHMVRSNFQSQRILALQMLGRIIKNYHQQTYHGKLTEDLLNQCLNAGLIFILRWSLDEQAEQIYSAAVAVLANVVYVKSDMDMIENVMYAEEGYKIPSLCTFYKKKREEMTQEEKEQDRDLTDAEIMQADVVKGLIQIQTLPRLRYIMEVREPSDNCIKNCLFVLTRIVLHNKETAYEVFKCSRLIEVIFKILSNSSTISSKQTYKVHALRFLKFICIAGKHMAATLLSTYKLEDVLSSTFSLSDNLTNKSTVESFVQTCQVWRILLLHGLSTNLAKNLYPIIINHLQQISINFKRFDDKSVASLITVIDAIFCSAIDGCFDMTIIDGLFELILHCVKTVQKDLFEYKKVTYPFFLSSLLVCCSSYYSAKNNMVLQVNPILLLDEVENFWTSHMQPILKSPFLNILFDELRVYSDFKTMKKRDVLHHPPPDCLPTFGTSYLLASGGFTFEPTIILMQAILKLSLQLININKNLISQAASILTSAGSVAFITFIQSSSHVKRSDILLTTRMELLIISHMLEIFQLVGEKLGYAMFGSAVVESFQQVAFCLLSWLQPGDEQHVVTLYQKIIFNSKIFKKQNYILWVAEHCDNNVEEIMKQQLSVSRNNLKHIGSMYETVLLRAERFQKKGLTSYMTASRTEQLIPTDWMFLPIVQLYNSSMKLESSGGIISTASEASIATSKRCLQFILLLEVTKSSVLANIDETLRLTRLLCLFLTEGCLFNEGELKDVLLCLLVTYSSPSFQSYLNFETTIPGVTSFYDIYCSLLDQYLSSSFGDYTFANFILFPIQLRHDVKFRRAVWTEYCEVLRQFPIPLTQVTCDIKRFLAAEEENFEMVRLYFKALITKKVRPTWCPVFYLIAVHHVNQFIFGDERKNMDGKTDQSGDIEKARTDFLDEILTLNNQECKDDVITYQCFDFNSPRGISKFTHLPPSRELLLRERGVSMSQR